MLQIYNTLSGKLEEFRPLGEGEVKFYYCGPTVWDYGHIGNFRSAIAADVLRRYLKFKGLRVTQAMNITDVDDRIITKAQESGKTIDDYTQKYIEAFWEDFDALGCERPEVAPRATRHIPDMVGVGRTGGRHGSGPGSDGAKEEADRGAGVGFQIFLVLQVLGDQDRMAEMHQRYHQQP